MLRLRGMLGSVGRRSLRPQKTSRRMKPSLRLSGRWGKPTTGTAKHPQTLSQTWGQSHCHALIVGPSGMAFGHGGGARMQSPASPLPNLSTGYKVYIRERIEYNSTAPGYLRYLPVLVRYMIAQEYFERDNDVSTRGSGD